MIQWVCVKGDSSTMHALNHSYFQYIPKFQEPVLDIYIYIYRLSSRLEIVFAQSIEARC